MGVLFWFLSSLPPGTCVGGCLWFPMHSLAFPPGLSASLAAQLTSALPSTPTLCCAGYKLHCLQPESWFPFSVYCFMRCIRMSPRLLLQKGRACISLPGSPHHPLLCHSSLDTCHTFHVSQLNECKLRQIV